jgi:hypothetical protein
MGLSEDEIRRVRLVDTDRRELHGHLLAPATDECRTAAWWNITSAEQRVPDRGREPNGLRLKQRSGRRAFF